jgi:hypothetical protein
MYFCENAFQKRCSMGIEDRAVECIIWKPFNMSVTYIPAGHNGITERGDCDGGGDSEVEGDQSSNDEVKGDSAELNNDVDDIVDTGLSTESWTQWE